MTADYNEDIQIFLPPCFPNGTVETKLPRLAGCKKDNLKTGLRGTRTHFFIIALLSINKTQINEVKKMK